MNGWLSLRVLFVSIIFLLSFLNVCYTSVYVFYPVQAVFYPQSPPVVFSGLNDFFVCVDVIRSRRSSLVFSDFESLPSGWGRLGGSWAIASGYKGNGLLGVDDNGGPGGSSVYYWDSSISSYEWLSASVKVRRYSGTTMWMGVSLLQQPTTSSRLYEISVYVTGNTGYLDIWYYNGRSWTSLYRSATSFPAPTDRWFILYINYSRSAATSTNYISAVVYSVDGSVLASGSVSVSGGRYFIPSRVGVDVDGGQAVFDDFVVSVSDSRYVYVEGAPQGFTLSLYDDLGNKVAEATSSGSTTNLNVLSDAVVGRGWGGVFRIYDASGNLCLAKNFVDSIVGSDTYALVVHRIITTFYDEDTRAEIQILFSTYQLKLPKTVVLSAVSVDDTTPYYAGIILYPEHSLIQPDLELVIEVSNSTSSDSLLISGASPPAGPVETSLIKIDSSTSLKVSIEASKESTNNSSRLYLELVYCVDPQLKSVCVYYPVTLEV